MAHDMKSPWTIVGGDDEDSFAVRLTEEHGLALQISRRGMAPDIYSLRLTPDVLFKLTILIRENVFDILGKFAQAQGPTRETAMNSVTDDVQAPRARITAPPVERPCLTILEMAQSIHPDVTEGALRTAFLAVGLHVPLSGYYFDHFIEIHRYLDLWPWFSAAEESTI